MQTIQVTLDDDLVTKVDQAIKETNTSRSAFTREALKVALDNYHQRKLLEKHRKGYLRYPVTPDEFPDPL